MRLLKEIDIKRKNEKVIRADCAQNVDFDNEILYLERLSDLLKQFYKNEAAKSIAEIGCGKCEYIEDLRKGGFNAVGYVQDNANRPAHVRKMDLYHSVSLGEKFDFVQSFAGHHIFGENEASFIDNLVNHAGKGLVLSWAILGQDGYMHVNNRDNDYIIQKIQERGFRYSQHHASYFRNEMRNSYGNTIMVFYRN